MHFAIVLIQLNNIECSIFLVFLCKYFIAQINHCILWQWWYNLTIFCSKTLQLHCKFKMRANTYTIPLLFPLVHPNKTPNWSEINNCTEICYLSIIENECSWTLFEWTGFDTDEIARRSEKNRSNESKNDKTACNYPINIKYLLKHTDASFSNISKALHLALQQRFISRITK